MTSIKLSSIFENGGARISGKRSAGNERCCRKGCEENKEGSPVIAVLGPAPAVIGRLLGKFRFQIIIKMSKQLDKSTERLERVLDEVDLDLKRDYGRTVSFFPDVDPATTM